jgi:hypothetical protein
MECEIRTENDKEERGSGSEGSRGAVAKHVLRIALVLWLSGQPLNRPCKSGEATK